MALKIPSQGRIDGRKRATEIWAHTMLEGHSCTLTISVEGQSATAIFRSGHPITIDGPLVDSVAAAPVDRLAVLFSVTVGDYRLETSEAEGNPIPERWQLMLDALTKATTSELRNLAGDLLGAAVSAHPNDLEGGLSDGDRKLLVVLRKPRKPNLVEKHAGDRKRARALLRILTLRGELKQHPQKEALAIKRPSGTADLADGRNRGAAPGAGAPKKREPSLIAMHKRLANLDYFEVLQLRRDATDEDVRTSWMTLAKRYHPDALGVDADPKSAEMAREVTAAINEAYRVLADRETREEYITRTEQEVKAAIIADPKAAARRFEQAQNQLKTGDLDNALVGFELACRSDTKNSLYSAYLALAQLRADPADEVTLRGAQGRIAAALAENPGSVELQLVGAETYRVGGLYQKARGCLNQALQLEPDNAAAQKALATLPAPTPQARKEEKAANGLLKRLFGKG